MPGDRRASFPILKDADNRVADQLLAERTCEALVIDGRGRSVIAGRLTISTAWGRAATVRCTTI